MYRPQGSQIQRQIALSLACSFLLASCAGATPAAPGELTEPPPPPRLIVITPSPPPAERPRTATPAPTPTPSEPKIGVEYQGLSAAYAASYAINVLARGAPPVEGDDQESETPFVELAFLLRQPMTTVLEPAVRVYAIADLERADPEATNALEELRAIIDRPPAARVAVPGPMLAPLTVALSPPSLVEFQNGSGVQYLAWGGYFDFSPSPLEIPAPISNQELSLTFQGFTDDGRFYVTGRFPVSAPFLMTTSNPAQNVNPDAIEMPAESVGQNQRVEQYNREALGRLLDLDPSAFTPALGLLTGIVESLEVSAPPTTDAPARAAPIVFASNRGGNYDLYMVNTDGTGLTQLTDDPAPDYSPACSPSLEPRQLAFVSERDGNREIYVIGVTGSNLQRVTEDLAEDFAPTWAPLAVIFVSSRDGNQELYQAGYQVSTGVSRPIRLTITNWNEDAPAWRDELLIFESDRYGNWELFTALPDPFLPGVLSEVTRLFNHPAADGSAQLGPAGLPITFTSDRDGDYEIYLMGETGFGPTNLTNNASQDVSPQWSADGQLILFSSNRDGNSEIYVMAADGSGPVNLTNDPGDDRLPAWCPPGTGVLLVGP